MKSRFIKVVSTLTVLSCCVSAIPLQAPAAIVQATTTATNPLTTGEEQTEALHPKMINQTTGETMDASQINFQPDIYLNDKFGEGQNVNVNKSINLFGQNSEKNVELSNVPDAYEFLMIVVESDPYDNGAGQQVTQTKEVSQVIKIGNAYYGLVKDTQQDYIKFSDPSTQLKAIYNRYLRVGFENHTSIVNAANPNDVNETGETLTYPYQYSFSKSGENIIQGVSEYSTEELTSGTLTDQHRKDGIVLEGKEGYLDNKMYLIPDYKPIHFSRPGFS